MAPLSYVKRYRPAEWLNTTPVDPVTSTIGIGLVNENGKKLRFRLDLADARMLSSSIEEYLSVYRRHVTSHSDKSEGMYSSPGSILQALQPTEEAVDA